MMNVKKKIITNQLKYFLNIILHESVENLDLDHFNYERS